MGKIGIYAGSFDPFTNGHHLIAEIASELVDLLVIAVADDPGKRYMFTPEERMLMIQDSFRAEVTGGYTHPISVRICPAGKLLTEFAASNAASLLFRGVRNGKDFEQEIQMARINMNLACHMDPEVFPAGGLQTIFIPAPDHVKDISSSYVKYMLHMKDWQEWVGEIVPPSVMAKLIERMKDR